MKGPGSSAPNWGVSKSQVSQSPWMVVWISLLVLLAASAGFSEEPGASDENYLYHTVQASLLVSDVERTGDAIEAWTGEEGGYLLLKSNEQVIVRFPYDKVGGFRDFLRKVSEAVIEVSLQAVDLRESILGIQSGIQSREEILQKNLSFIDQADVSGTLAIEREIMQLLSEIENLKGRLRKLTVDRAFARADVSLRFMERSLPTDIPSSFGWINSIDFYEFMRRGWMH